LFLALDDAAAHLQYMQSLVPIDSLREQDLGESHIYYCIYMELIQAAVVQICYALQRSIGYRTNPDLQQVRSHASHLFPLAADNMLDDGTAEARRSPRWIGMGRRSLYTSEAKALFDGISGHGVNAFGADASISDSQMLGMCTMLHYILFQEKVRPHVGALTHHGLGTLASGFIDTLVDHTERVPLLVGLVQMGGLPASQVGGGRGVVYAAYGVNRPSFTEGHPNCSLEEEHGTKDSTVSFGYWNSPDFVFRTKNQVSVAAVYNIKAISAWSELVWNYAGFEYPDSAAADAADHARRPASPGY
jgi:hypothetical protein